MKRNVALIILYDEENKILLQHRDKNIKRLPGYWAFFGGGIENQENPKTAVKRETFEELNYSLVRPKLIMIQKIKNTKYVFVEKCKDKSLLTLQEGQAMGWYAISETKKLKMSVDDRKILGYIKTKL